MRRFVSSIAAAAILLVGGASAAAASSAAASASAGPPVDAVGAPERIVGLAPRAPLDTCSAEPFRGDPDLRPGQEIDRYGGEGGRFVGPDDTPYAWRAIPPSNLVGVPAAECYYHEYRVLRPFTVYGGPIAPWFGQPGGGVQYQLDGSLIPGAPARVDVAWLLAHGYLARVR